MTRRHSNCRPAFTLIELLIVIAIIAVLFALSSAAYFYAIGRQYEKNTNATIEHVYGVLKNQWKHVIAEARNEPTEDGVRQLAAPDPSGERAKVIWVMLRLAEAFPQTFDEIQTPAINSYLSVNKPKYQTNYRSELGKLKSSATTRLPESSVCLFLALSTAKGGYALNADQMPVKPQPSGYQKPNNADLLQFNDAWGQPLAFFRFPYANTKLASKAPSLTGPKGTYFNPLDPMKSLQSAWAVAANKTKFENGVQFEIGDWYTAPTIVSAGGDNLLDLTFINVTRNFPDMSEVTLANTKDNLYSFDIVAP